MSFIKEWLKKQHKQHKKEIMKKLKFTINIGINTYKIILILIANKLIIKKTKFFKSIMKNYHMQSKIKKYENNNQYNFKESKINNL